MSYQDRKDWEHYKSLGWVEKILWACILILCLSLALMSALTAIRIVLEFGLIWTR